MLKRLNTPADLLSQLCQANSLILRLYACSTGIISNCKCAKTLEDASQIFNNERITNQKEAMVSLYQIMILHFTLVFKLLSSNCTKKQEKG